jgi:hypothetical protein
MPRPEPSFPIRFELFKPTRFSKEESVMYFAHEWDAYQKTLHHDDQPTTMPAKSSLPPTATAAVAPEINQAPTENTVPAPPAAPAAVLSELSTLAPILPASSTPPSTSPTSPTSFASMPSAAPSRTPPDFSRHSRRCCICLHPDRDAIEGDFIRWRSPELIAREYKLANRTSIYRHAHCTGLFAWRRRELGRVLEGMLENHEHIPLEASDAIVRAARVYAHLNENGNWFEPARINFVLTGPAPAISRPEPFQLTHEFQTKNEISKRRAKSRTPRSRRRGIVASKQNRVRRSPVTSRRPSSNRNSRFTEKRSSK